MGNQQTGLKDYSYEAFASSAAEKAFQSKIQEEDRIERENYECVERFKKDYFKCLGKVSKDFSVEIYGCGDQKEAVKRMIWFVKKQGWPDEQVKYQEFDVDGMNDDIRFTFN